jgi:hypothetical protein
MNNYQQTLIRVHGSFYYRNNKETSVNGISQKQEEKVAFSTKDCEKRGRAKKKKKILREKTKKFLKNTVTEKNNIFHSRPKSLSRCPPQRPGPYS